jgi:large subunit ribosomal protein L5
MAAAKPNRGGSGGSSGRAGARGGTPSGTSARGGSPSGTSARGGSPSGTSAGGSPDHGSAAGSNGGGSGQPGTPAPPPRLRQRYQAEVAPALREEFSYSNVMQIPNLSKIVVNMGVGEAARDAKLIDGAVRDLTVITGQKPAVARARKSVAQFKLREGMPIGAHVTLRGTRMWEFCDRLLTLALPRIRDFRGLSDKQFDGRGNYTFGLTEQLMFHEINPNQVDRQRGMDVTVVTTATNDAEGRALLRHLGFPFREN